MVYDCLQFSLKAKSDVAASTDDGRLFHVRGVATGNASLPRVDQHPRLISKLMSERSVLCRISKNVNDEVPL